MAHRHPDTVVFAAGVSSVGAVSEQQFAREADLLYPVLRGCAAHGRRVVYFSTSSASMYGGQGSTGRESDPVYPPDPYGRHKLALESVVAASGAEHLLLRLSHTIGAGQPPHQLLPALVRQITAGRLRVFRGAHRDLIDVADVVRIVDDLLTAGVVNEVVNVATGVGVPVEEVLDHVERRLRPGRPVTREYVDRPGTHDVSIEKLRRLIPGVDRLRFGPDYFRAVIDRYLDATLGVPS
ncbi:NAD-dependent epimerase/dehydratase family protein [Dactylosporangium aurantiacum]|uniref:NAD-dependent epimerase/dehydratase family protein n=1 Tax=Dactylosporangium aurantiacum TaxID=35754 RepID=UPI001FE1C627|nr:NAD-dependent epimerase/dehydratase family protein [Dactylosporangium aurantiacum]MDG6103894.1 NAD-dependent epimerase/dehydratase family protein [Dactylosporangium aurantiacum]